MNIEQLKEAVEYYKNGLHNLITETGIERFETLKSLAEKVIEQNGKMPNKKPIVQHYDDFANGWDTGFNHAIDHCTHAMAGKELKQEVQNENL
jgi:hypothetical protein